MRGSAHEPRNLVGETGLATRIGVIKGGRYGLQCSATFARLNEVVTASHEAEEEG